MTVLAVALDPAGRLVAGGHADGSISLWDESSGLRKFELREHTEAVRGVAFAPGRRELASCSVDGRIVLWDLEEGAHRVFAQHESALLALAYSPDGNLLASGGEDGTARLWDAHTGAHVATLTHGGSVLGVAWRPDGLVVTGSWDRTVRVWSAAGQELAQFPSPWGQVLGVACAADGRIAIACGMVAQVLGDDPEAPLVELRDERGTCYAVAFTGDGALLAGIGIRVALQREGAELVELRGHSGKINALACRRWLAASGSDDGTVRLWDLRGAAPLRVLARDT